MIESIIPPEERCQICGKRKAELLCDMPKGRAKMLHIKNPDLTTDYKNSFKSYMRTCDKRICDKCAVDLGNDIHFCKGCMNNILKKRGIE